MSKFLTFKKQEVGGRVVYEVRGKNKALKKPKDNNPLGSIWYYKLWRCWIFEPCSMTIYSPECMRDIADFIDNIKSETPIIDKILKEEGRL